MISIEFASDLDMKGTILFTDRVLQTETSCGGELLHDDGYNISNDDSCHFGNIGSKNNVNGVA